MDEMVVITAVFWYVLLPLLLQINDVSAQTSCVISPNLTTLTIANGLRRDVEFHCHCMDSNGMMITGTRWFHNGSLVPIQSARTSSITDPYQIKTTLYFNAPFIIDHSHTGTYICSPNSVLPTIPPGDEITLDAQDPSGADRACAIYLPNVTNTGEVVHIPSGTQNVILYCICRRFDNNVHPVAVGPITWFINDTSLTRTTADGNNPYSRDNIPSPLIIPLFTADNVGRYSCSNYVCSVRGQVFVDLVLSTTQPPTNVRATVITPRSVVVTWTVSSSSDVTGYNISYTTTASYTSGGSVSVSDNNANSGTLINLEEATTYIITIQAISNSENASSDPVSVTTHTDVPSSPPQNVMVTSVNPASLRVSWQPPPMIDHNGPITGHVIQYTRVGSSDMMSVNVNSGTTHTISGLVAYVDYSVTVAARTVDGTGPFSNPVVGRSGEDVPTAPRSLMIVNVTDTTVILSWMPPDPPNGIIRSYRVQYKRSDRSSYNNSIDTNTTDLTYTLTGLMNGTVYDFRVRAKTVTVNYGPPSNVVITVFGIPPVITLHPMDTDIQLFTNFIDHTLICKANLASSYRWERQNDVITSDSTGVNTNTLTLINLQPGDAGNYRCVVTNAHGSTESNYASVTISILAPRVVTDPTNTSAAAPFGALFSCSIQVYGYLTITWYRNNRRPVPSKAYSMVIPSMNETTSILTIPNVTSEDVGKYYCEASSNRIAAISLKANLFLADPPSPPVVMIDSVVNLTVNNYNLTIKCLPVKDNFNYKWIKKNNVLPSRAQGVNTSQLTIVNLKPEDSGDYQCVMSNSTGTISSNFSTIEITVSMPTILEQPNNMTINVYESVTFKCTAHGFGVLKIVWKRFKYKMPVTAEVTEEKSLNKVTSILKIIKTAGYYSGQYYCVVENEVGTVVSHIANLYIQAPKPEIIICPENVTVPPNDNFTMNCLALSFGLLKYYWSKRDGNLPQTAVQSYIDNILFDPLSEQATSVYNLAVYNVQPSDEGWYCCVATNEAGITVYCAWLEVNTLANISTQPMPGTFKVGDVNVIAVSCSAFGMGPIYYQWEKYNSSNNSWISPSHRAVNISLPDLKFSVIREEDEGVYRCIVINDDGSVISDNATVHVYGPPIIKFISNYTLSAEGCKVNLICSAVNDVDAIHPLQIYWYKGNKLVTPNGRHIIVYIETDNATRQLNSTLLLDPVNRTDDGVYTCRAFNRNDSFSELNTTLTVQYPPFVSIVNESPYMTNVGSLAILYCRAIGKPIPRVQWYKDNTTVNVSSLSIIVPTDMPHTTVYTCKGTNYIKNVKFTRSASITVIVKVIKPCLPLLDAPVNGRKITIEADGITKHIIFSCNPNYLLKGVSFATCNDGVWSSSTPTCTKL